MTRETPIRTGTANNSRTRSTDADNTVPIALTRAAYLDAPPVGRSGGRGVINRIGHVAVAASPMLTSAPSVSGEARRPSPGSEAEI
jgi:hypothetical protein